MKKLLLGLVLLVCLASCAEKSESVTSRIKVTGQTMVSGYFVTIIKIDSIEFVLYKDHITPLKPF